MNHTVGFITLDGLLTLNPDEVQAHLNSVQWPNPADLNQLTTFYQETRAIFLIIASIESFLVELPLNNNIDMRSHLLALRAVLDDEYQTRLHYMSNPHGSN